MLALADFVHNFGIDSDDSQLRKAERPAPEAVAVQTR